MRYNDSFWAVCIDGFDIKMADVVCRQLGFRHGALGMGQVDGFSFATLDTSLDTILFSASCVGNENNFDECIDVTWSERTCSMDRQVAMFCALPYYEGCYESSTPVGIADDSQTLHGLVGLCRIFRYDYAGSSKTVGDSHRCGHSLSEFGTLVDDSFCAELCGNDPYQLCGGIGAYRAVYSTLLGSTGYTLTNNSGSITSYDYPGKYAANDHQVWEVTFGSTHRVQITFPAFNINFVDVITISAGGKNETFNSRRTWISDPISSFVVRFESRSSGTGFIMNYEVYIPNISTTKVPVPSTQQVPTSTQKATATTSNQAMSTADLGMTDSATVVPTRVPPAETTMTQRTITSEENSNPDVRIVNGLTPREGRVEIRINGVWGTICDENLSFNDAIVVCRTLGFTGALGTTSFSEFGPSFGNIHLDNIQCDGTEADVMECLRNIPDPQPQCLSSFREAGVRCSDCRDVHPLCIAWASQGACESYPGNVWPVCQSSCNQCDIFGKNGSAPSLPLKDTCVLGHCFVDENNASRCISAVEICFTVGWYQGLICLPTPVKPVPSTVRCMNPDEHTQTNLPIPSLIEELLTTINELKYASSTLENDSIIALDRLTSLLTNLDGVRLLPMHIYNRQNQATVLVLYGVNLHHIDDDTFSGFPSLRTLVLAENNIQELHNTTFSGLQLLQLLNLRQNRIISVENDSFADLKSLLFLELANNSLVRVQPGAFTGLINLRSLGLSENKIRRIEQGFFYGMESLQFLYMESNNISEIEVGSFSELRNLQLLNLSSNSIQHLQRGMFAGLFSLSYLDLINNHIQSIDGFTFEHMASLQFIFFLGTELRAVSPDALTGLTSLEKMSTSDNRLCCLLEDNADFTCARTSQTSPLDTCSRLYPNLALRIAGWVMGLLALGGNGAVLFIRLRDRKKKVSRVQNTFIASLAMADILMGLYMIIITSADVYYGNEFYLSAPQWRGSQLCRFAGFLGFLSSEASILTLTLITVDRFICIMFPFRPDLKIERKSSLILVGAVWVFTIMLSLSLVIITSYRPDVYGLSDVCLGLPLHVEAADTGVLEITGNFFFEYQVNFVVTDNSSRPPWLFSLIIFIGFNLVSFTFILICYIMIFIKSSRSSAKVRKNRSNKQETRLAVRMAMIVATDLVCWMPVIIMGILSQTGAVTLDPSLYAWTVILIVPINSTINPFLYTFIVYVDALIKKRRKQKYET
ncbi:uncharacterized protein LOC129267821 [Lytechinus pictus]|uniref:uncharacterized protein LOC129267821 n=1 Tax=Lytechinus pictus TaxID=7653 RepID=UPI0030B9E907